MRFPSQLKGKSLSVVKDMHPLIFRILWGADSQQEEEDTFVWSYEWVPQADSDNLLINWRIMTTIQPRLQNAKCLIPTLRPPSLVNQTTPFPSGGIVEIALS